MELQRAIALYPLFGRVLVEFRTGLKVLARNDLNTRIPPRARVMVARMENQFGGREYVIVGWARGARLGW